MMTIRIDKDSFYDKLGTIGLVLGFCAWIAITSILFYLGVQGIQGGSAFLAFSGFFMGVVVFIVFGWMSGFLEYINDTLHLFGWKTKEVKR